MIQELTVHDLPDLHLVSYHQGLLPPLEIAPFQVFLEGFGALKIGDLTLAHKDLILRSRVEDLN
jgi:hypothetical protein